MKRLIVVADNSLIVEAIRAGMRESGAFELVGYADPRKTSARLIAETEAEVLLVDEGEQASEAIDLIRGVKERRKEIAIIVLTVKMEGDWLVRALAAGASGVVSKSVHPVALATLVREAVSGHIGHPLKSVTTDAASAPPVGGDDRSSLTERELQVLRLVAAGATNVEIARRLWITDQTVKFHVSNIYRKLHVTNRTEACHYAHLNRLVAPREAVRAGPVSSAGEAAPAASPAVGRRHAASADRALHIQPRVDPGTA